MVRNDYCQVDSDTDVRLPVSHSNLEVFIHNFCVHVFTTRWTQSAVMPQSGCLSDRPSVTFRYPDHIGLNTSKIISTLISLKFMLELIPTSTTPPKLGWSRGGVQKTCNISVTIGPRLLWRTNRKSHTRFRCIPKSMTSDDHERPIRTLGKKDTFTEPTRKIWMKIDPNCQRQNLVLCIFYFLGA